MQKQALTKLMIEKIRQKQQEELRTRPHYEIFKLNALFQYEINLNLKQDIVLLEQQLIQEQNVLQKCQQCLQDIDNTGYRALPRIVIKPEFIASENINFNIKQFYRKSSNTFLRLDLNRNKRFQQSSLLQRYIGQSLSSIKKLQKQIQSNRMKDRKTTNDRRLNNLRQSLKIRSLHEQQENFRCQMKQLYQTQKQIIDDYNNITANKTLRMKHMSHLQKQITKYKQHIEQAFNLQQYRKFNQILFKHGFKKDILAQKLNQIKKELKEMEFKIKDQDDIKVQFFKKKVTTKQPTHSSNKKIDLSHYKRAKTEQSKQQTSKHKLKISNYSVRLKDSQDLIINASQIQKSRVLTPFSKHKSIRNSVRSTSFSYNHRVKTDNEKSFW